MSEFVVEVVRISDVKPHPNADALDVALIDGKQFQTIVKRGQYSPGDTAIYVPYDAMVPDDVADKWGVSSYLSKGRVKAIRLRGEMSYGFLTDVADGVSVAVGDDLAGMFGITKYDPPPTFSSGDNERDHPQFYKYTSIENIRRYPDMFVDGEPVVVTEKIHGTNSRVGLVIDYETGNEEFVCGSHNMRKKIGTNHIYETPLGMGCVKDLLTCVGSPAILFGEIYGWKVQDLAYGHTQREPIGYAAFDLSINGGYVDHREFVSICEEFGVPMVPELYSGPFDMGNVLSLSSGRTQLGADHIREGVVVKPLSERTDPRIGRVILKSISDDYITRNGGTESK